MKHCENCQKNLHLWNKYYRQYPCALFINGKIKNIYFCSEKCIEKYAKENGGCFK